MSFMLLPRLTLLCGLVLLLLLPKSGSAKVNTLNPSASNDYLSKNLPPLDPSRYPPEQPPAKKGGFRRGCLPGDQFPARFALVPEAYNFGGLTQSEQPTLWFHLPVDLAGAPEENKTITLRLYALSQNDSVSENERMQIERMIFPMPTLQAGIVGISLAGSDIRLPMDELLFWEVAIHCGGPLDLRDSIEPPTTTGWIQRVAPLMDVAVPAEADAAIVLSQRYLENGLWYDAVEALSPHMLDDLPADEISAAWQQLILDSEIEDVANATTVQVIELND